jgi:hypothetical protein
MARQAPFSDLEPEDYSEPSHGVHDILSGLRGRRYPTHRPRVWLPEAAGVQRMQRPSQS